MPTEYGEATPEEEVEIALEWLVGDLSVAEVHFAFTGKRVGFWGNSLHRVANALKRAYEQGRLTLP